VIIENLNDSFEKSKDSFNFHLSAS